MIGRHAILDRYIREHAKLLDVGAAHWIKRSVIESSYDRSGTQRFLNSLLERRAEAAVKAQLDAGQGLAQTVANVRHDTQQIVHGAGQHVIQSVRQGLDSALSQGTAKYDQAVAASTAKLDSACRAVSDTLEFTNNHARRQMWMTYGAILGALVLLVGGGLGLLWFEWQSYNDAKARTAAAQVDAETMQAYAQVGITSCGGRPCIRLDSKSPRWGEKGEYVLLDMTERSKPTH